LKVGGSEEALDTVQETIKGATTASIGSFSYSERVGPTSDVASSLAQQQLERQDRANALLQKIYENTYDEAD
jgi:hypothetical protein